MKTIINRDHARALVKELSRAHDLAITVSMLMAFNCDRDSEFASKMARANDLVNELASARDLAKALVRTKPLHIVRDLAKARDLTKILEAASGYGDLTIFAPAEDLAKALQFANGNGHMLYRNISEAATQCVRRGIELQAAKLKPPAFAERLLMRLVPPDWNEAVLGDFLETYERKFAKTVSQCGASTAQINYWWQVIRSVPGFLQIRIRRIPAAVSLKRRKTESQ